MNDKELSKLIETIKHTLKCPLCSTEYVFEEIRFVGNVNDATVLEMHCLSCGLDVLATVLAHQRKDLSRMESFRFGKRDEIAADELIELHKFLDGFDGDFGRLFGDAPQEGPNSK